MAAFGVSMLVLVAVLLVLGVALDAPADVLGLTFVLHAAGNLFWTWRYSQTEQSAGPG